jgi:hypothetical protein
MLRTSLGYVMNAIEGTRGGLILAFVAALAAVLALARPALATYPGANGKLAFESTHGDRDILSVNLDGTGLRNLTANGANNGALAGPPTARRSPL